jgi:multidrug efflux pump
LGKFLNKNTTPAIKTTEGPITEKYTRLLRKLLMMPGKTLGISFLIMVSVFILYSFLNKGLEFFPNIEPEFGLIQIQARGD